jgi:signal transduction histidine kinase/DNA-binding response OmpR family regulator
MTAAPVHVLLVEDNPGDARLIQETLREASGYRHSLSHASTLGAAMERLAEGGVDVLLLDLSLPDAHGLDTVSRAAASAPHVPIVVLTGLDDETTAVAALTAGAQDYLTKGTLDPVLLVRTLRHARERKRMESEREELLHRERVARADAEAAERRARILADASEVLSVSLDATAALTGVCRMAAGTLAECAVVILRTEEGDSLTATAVAHVDPSREEALWALARAAAADGPGAIPGTAGPGDREPVRVAIPKEEAEPEGGGALRQLLHRLGARGFVAAPLVVRGESIGVLLLASGGDAPDFAAPDLTLAAEVARRAALAVDNAGLYEKAQRALRARGEVLRVVSHDLGNALSALAVNTTVLLRTLPAGEDWVENARGRITAMRSLVDQLQRLRQDLLDAVAIDAGKLSVHPARHDPWSILQQVMEEFSALVSERSLTLEMDAAPDLPEVAADRLRVLQVFGNLVGNATKFTPVGGRVTVGAAVDADEVVFRVADTGQGIASEHLPHVFDRFWKTPQHNHEGAGLGLAITRGIVEAHGGRIWVEAAPGVGSVFFFTLPVA